MEEELEVVLKIIKTKKVAGLNEIPTEVRKTRKFDNIHLWLCNVIYEWKSVEEGCIFTFLKKSDLIITKNYRGINSCC